MEFMWHPTFQDLNGNTATSNIGLFTHDFINRYAPPCDIPISAGWNDNFIYSNYNDWLRITKKNHSKFLSCLN